MDRPNLSGGRPAAGAILLALAVPPLFLHARYSPGFSVGSVDVELADVAVAAVAVASLAQARATGVAPVRGARAVLAAAAALLLLVLAATLWGPLVTAGYPLGANLVTAAKYAEYAVLLAAVPLLLRRRADLDLLLAAVVAWSAAATLWGALQFLGLVDEFEGRRPGQRETSFLGVHDFAALSAAALAIGLVGLALGTSTRAARARTGVALVAGALGVVLSGALASVGAVAVGAGLVAAVAARRGSLSVPNGAALATVVAIVVAGASAIRSADLDQFLRFLGVSPAREETTSEVQSYAQRTVLAYIGIRIFADHPLLGVGWQGSVLEDAYGPYLDGARRRYPDVTPRALPSPEHPWGVQNAFVQAGADMGVGGLAALVAVLAAGFLTAVRGVAARADPEIALVAALWLVVAAAELTALGLFAGVPIDALLWLGLGLSVASRRV